MNAKAKMMAIQRTLGERARLERELVDLRRAAAAKRKRIRELDAALALQATPGIEEYFNAIEGKQPPAIAGRIGVAHG